MHTGFLIIFYFIFPNRLENFMGQIARRLKDTKQRERRVINKKKSFSLELQFQNEKKG